jgi:hypothetical protein
MSSYSQRPTVIYQFVTIEAKNEARPPSTNSATRNTNIVTRVSNTAACLINITPFRISLLKYLNLVIVVQGNIAIAIAGSMTHAW